MLQRNPPGLIDAIRARFAHVESCPFQGNRIFFENAEWGADAKTRWSKPRPGSRPSPTIRGATTLPAMRWWKSSTLPRQTCRSS